MKKIVKRGTEVYDIYIGELESGSQLSDPFERLTVETEVTVKSDPFDGYLPMDLDSPIKVCKISFKNSKGYICTGYILAKNI